MRCVTIVGARPQFIKASVVSRALRRRDGLVEILVHTGQHYDANMSDVFFEELEIPQPDYHLGVGSGPHGEQTGRMLEAIEKVLRKEKSDAVLVYGDTNSTLAGALAAAKLCIPVAHVEAGLRCFNRRMPEELNRLVVDHLAALLLAPTQTAVDNLAAEGIAGPQVRLVGDVMYDVALYYGQKAAAKSHILDALRLCPKEYVLATVHRAENTDDPGRLAAICDGLARVASETPVVLPLHPRTRAVVDRQGWLRGANPRLQVTAPLGYLDMLLLEKNAQLIATDSGGVQKEAYFYRVPCVTLRDETEWVELVAAGANRLCPPCSAEAVARFIRESMTESFPARASQNLYGDGHAAEQVATAVCKLP
jgi:UDP-GlcNAc3NAcA epimerase